MRALGQVGKSYSYLGWVVGALFLNAVLVFTLPTLPAAYFGGVAMGYAVARIRQ